MKRTWFLLLAVIAISSCKKPEVQTVPETPHVAAKKEIKEKAVTALPESPAVKVKDAEVTAENERMRPRPRPPEVKKEAPPVEPNPAVPIAVTLAGKPGYVTSPHSGKIIDVRDIPPGTLVQDPEFPQEEKKYFRVP